VVEFKDSESVNWSVSNISDTLVRIEARVDTTLSIFPIKLVATDNLISTSLDAILPHGIKSIAFGDSAGVGSDSTYYSNYIGYMAGMNSFNSLGNNGIGLMAGSGTVNAIGCEFIGAFSGQESENISNSVYLGNNSGNQSKNIGATNYIGSNSGMQSTNIYGSNIIGASAGLMSDSLSYTNFIGYGAGNQSDYNFSSNFIGREAGSVATRSSYSNMIGYQSGAYNDSTNYSNFIGFKAGISANYSGASVKNNNIIIGTNITLPPNSENRINIGGILFGMNTHATVTGNSSSAANLSGRIGIGVVSPTAKFHVMAGSVTVPSMKIDSGVLLNTKQKYAIENDGTHLYYTTKDTVRKQLDNNASTGGASYLYSIGSDSVEVSTYIGSGGENLIMGQRDPSFDRYTWFDGEANTFFGSRVTPYAYTASANTGIGSFAGYYLYTGYQNFFGGYGSGSYLTNGNNNTLVGASTGYNPLAESNTDYQITTDSAMVLVGFGATKNNAAKLSNSIAIGAGAQVTTSNQVVLGNTYITATTLRGTVTVPTLKVTTTGYGLNKILASDAAGLLSYVDMPSPGSSYTLPTASATVKGGVKVGAGLFIIGDSLNALSSTGTYNRVPKYGVNGKSLVNSNLFTSGVDTLLVSTNKGSSDGYNIFIGGGGQSITGSGGGPGSRNSYYGAQAGIYTTSGDGNVASGFLALYYNTTGSRNTAIGHGVLFNNITGSGNIAIGDNAGADTKTTSVYNTAPEESIYIGSNTKSSGINNTNEIVIGRNTIGHGSNTTTIGDSASTTKAYINGFIQLPKTGDGTNYTSFEADGTLVMEGNATVFDDIGGDAIALKSSGSHLTENAAEAMMQYSTSATLTDYMYTNVQLSHSWAGTTVYPHIHFMETTSSMPNFLLQYRYQALGGAKTTAWTDIKCNTAALGYSSGTIQQISKTASGLTVTGGHISDVIQFRVIRDVSNSSGLFTGTDPVGAAVDVLSFDVHYEKNTLGSRTESAK
jgi:hypothetical protein